MSISMYRASVPVFIRALTNLRSVLGKGEAFVEAKKIKPEVLLNDRLCADMFPLTRQVQIATDMAKGCGARLAGVEVPKYEDNEASFAELYARIDKTLGFLKALKPEQIDGSEGRDITLPSPRGAMEFKGLDYLLGFVTPNLYFHCTTAYAILRHNGVELGKMDFIGQP
ncbi:MAG TPA: DUF1993 domain-containing protein [Nevskia sp.]|nr:DUF1993 domain-containing protein [Nevskia sp.]